MAAGLGFKTFVTGEVLTAADTNGYLMQGVNVFANAAARDAQITSPQEGQFCYLKDTNVSMFYTGAAWANLDTTGMTNPMTTTADMIYSSSGSTPARLGIGTVGQVLAVNSGATAPEWVTGTSSFATSSNFVATSETTSSTTFTGLTTAGAVTVTTGTKALVSLSAVFDNQAGTNVVAYMGFAVSGATTVAAADQFAVGAKLWVAPGNFKNKQGAVFLVTGLTAGSNTFTSQFKKGSGDVPAFAERTIAVINLGS